MALARHPALAADRGECARSLPSGHEPEKRVRKSGYRPLGGTSGAYLRGGCAPRAGFALLVCPSCQGRMRLLAVVRNPVSIARYLAGAGELTDVPTRAPGRGPPYWKSRVFRRQALGSDGSDHGEGDEAA